MTPNPLPEHIEQWIGRNSTHARNYAMSEMVVTEEDLRALLTED